MLTPNAGAPDSIVPGHRCGAGAENSSWTDDTARRVDEGTDSGRSRRISPELQRARDSLKADKIRGTEDPSPNGKAVLLSARDERQQLEADKFEVGTLRAQLEQDRKWFEYSKQLVLGDRAGRPLESSSEVDGVVVLNVGGEALVEVQRSTLCVFEGSHLADLFSGSWEQRLPRDAKGHLFIDARADAFVPLIEFLRQCRFERTVAAATEAAHAASNGLGPGSTLEPQLWRVPVPTFERQAAVEAFAVLLRYYGLDRFVHGGFAGPGAVPDEGVALATAEQCQGRTPTARSPAAAPETHEAVQPSPCRSRAPGNRRSPSPPSACRASESSTLSTGSKRSPVRAPALAAYPGRRTSHRGASPKSRASRSSPRVSDEKEVTLPPQRRAERRSAVAASTERRNLAAEARRAARGSEVVTVNAMSTRSQAATKVGTGTGGQRVRGKAREAEADGIGQNWEAGHG